MAITQDELNSIISSVLSSIRTNSKTIEQMTPATSLGETDYFEVSGGKKVSYSVLKELIGSMLTDDIDSLRTQIEQAKTLAQTAKTTAETMQTSKEDVVNKVTTIDADATDEQYPTAKAVRDVVSDEENFDTLEEQFTSNRISYAVGTDGSVRKAASIPIDITPGCYIELSTNYFYGINYCFLKSVDSLRQGLSPDLSSYNTGSIHLDRPNVFKTYAPEDATILLIIVDETSCKTTKLYLKSSRLDKQQIAIEKIDNRVVSLGKGMEYNIDNEVNAENIYSLSQENVVYNLLENITIDVSKCETLDGVKIIRIPSNSKLNMNGHYIHASNNVYLYNAGEVPCCIDFESNQKGMLNGVLLKGLFSFAKDVFLTNIATNYTQAAFVNNLKTTLACIANSNIIWDVDNTVSSGTPEAGDTTLTNNSHIDGRGHTFSISENLIIGEGCSIKNATIKSLYGGGIYMNDDSILDKCIVTKNKISIQGDRCSILNCTIEMFGIFVYGDYALINKNKINCGSQSASRKPIFVTSSNNTITENFCNSGFTGIQFMFDGGKDRKCIENNYVARNHISGQAEEALAMDQAGNRYMNNGEFIGFADNTSAYVLKIKFEEDLAELDDYVGFYIYGISDTTIGYFAKITAVEDATDYTLVTVDRIMFDVLKESSESTPYYPFNEQSAIERGYKDYSKSMFAVGSVFVNNIFENNIIEKDSICLYGAGFYNSFINNRTMSNSAIALYMISNSKSKYMNKVKVLPICYNLVSGNTVLNGDINSSYSDNFGDNNIVDKDERVTENYIAYNSFISNFCKTIYNEGFACYIDTSLVVGKRNNSPYSYNNGIDSKNNIIGLGFIEESTNMNTILNSSTRRVIVKKEDGKFGIYAGNNEGAYKTVPIIEDIV